MTDRIVEDDAQRIIAILRAELQDLAFEYLLTEAEFEEVLLQVMSLVDSDWIRNSYKLLRASSSQDSLIEAIREHFEPIYAEKIAKRNRIELPTLQELFFAVENLPQ